MQIGRQVISPSRTWWSSYERLYRGGLSAAAAGASPRRQCFLVMFFKLFVLLFAALVESNGFNTNGFVFCLSPPTKNGLGSHIFSTHCFKRKFNFAQKSRRSKIFPNFRCEERNVEVSKGLNILELTGSVVSQGYLVKMVKAGVYFLTSLVFPCMKKHCGSV